MKLAVLGPGEKFIRNSTKRIIEEAKKEFKNVDLVPLIDVKLRINKGVDVIWNNKSLKDYDYILPRIDSKRAAIGYPIISFLDDLNVAKPYPASTVLIAHNKFLTLQEMVKNNISVPETWLTGSRDSAFEIIEKEKMPLMIKILAGFGGEGVMVMESKDAAKSVLDAMTTLKQEVLIEKYLPNQGEDIRIMIAGQEVIAGFKRIAKNEEKRANIHLGGRAVSFRPTPEMKEIALKAADAVNSKICAIDIIESKGKIYVVEVNINPGLGGIEEASGINVAKHIVDFVKSEIKQ